MYGNANIMVADLLTLVVYVDPYRSSRCLQKTFLRHSEFWPLR